MKPEQSERLLEAFVLTGLVHEIAQKLWEEHFSFRQPSSGYQYEHVYFAVKFYFTEITDRLFSPEKFDDYALGKYNIRSWSFWDLALAKASRNETD